MLLKYLHLLEDGNVSEINSNHMERNIAKLLSPVDVRNARKLLG